MSKPSGLALGQASSCASMEVESSNIYELQMHGLWSSRRQKNIPDAERLSVSMGYTTGGSASNIPSGA